MNAPQEPIQEFWNFFQAHRADFDILTDTSAPFWDAALGQLQQLDKQLWFELSKPNGAEREFIITAEGHAEVFPLVESMVAHAPKVQGWQFIALKPPRGFDFKITYEGIRFEPRDMWFLPLENEANPEKLGLRMGVPSFTADIEREATNAVLVILETGLGERAAALDVQYLEIVALPESAELDGYIELSELPAYIAWRKKRHQNL